MERDVQAALGDIHSALERHAQRVEERLDTLTAVQYDLRGDIKQAAGKAQQAADLAKDTNGRVRELERWRSYLLGGMTVITFMLTIAAGYVALAVR